MILAVLSGKGGTGKTTVSLNLARAAGQADLLDCDVEEPNAHLFLKPAKVKEERQGIEIPEISKEKCTNCGACARFCRFHCFISAPSLTLVIPELCHSCGGCTMVCPTGAINYISRETGSLFQGKKGEINLSWGTLDVGELSGVKLITALKKKPMKAQFRIIDCPPGTACSTVEAVEESDFALIVAEPTPFGISDMLMVIEMLETMNIPRGVVINKAGLGDEELRKICREKNLPIIGELPFSRDAAAIYARGRLLYEESPEFRVKFEALLKEINNGN